MIINSHNSWSQLEEVWLGDVYPAAWYDYLNSEVRDCFYKLTENTKEDLAIIQRKIEEFGVTVRRPEYKSIDEYMVNGQLVKPQICPRDNFSVIGNTLRTSVEQESKPWQDILDLYATDPNVTVISEPWLPSSASMVRIGRDLYLDFHHQATGPNTKESITQIFLEEHLHKFNDYRVHLLFNGGHIDGCFSAIKPNVLLTTNYFDYYTETFPGWNLIHCTKPEFWSHMPDTSSGAPGYNGNWWFPGTENNKSFNEHVLNHAQTWVGNYTETYFEVNCLVINEKNVLMLGEHEPIFRELEKFGITAHSLPFRTRSFWDGALHCLTLDIRRQSSIEDYFPERGDQKLFSYS